MTVLDSCAVTQPVSDLIWILLGLVGGLGIWHNRYRKAVD